jgi:hypothetical protein
MTAKKTKKSAKAKIKDLPVSKKPLSAGDTEAIKGGFLKVPGKIAKPTLSAADIP